MRERNQQINIRVTVVEKEKIRRKAKQCGMGDAEYIRNCALSRQIREMPREGLRTAYLKIGSLISYLEKYRETQKERDVLKSVQEILLDLYRGKGVTDNGGNKNLESN